MKLVFLAAALLLSADIAESPAFKEGTSLYTDLEFEEAAEKFQAAAAEVELPAEERALAQVWVGMCHAGIGEDGKAREALAVAIDLHAEVVLPEIAPPKVRQIVGELREEAAAAAEASSSAAAAEATASVEAAADNAADAEASAGGEIPFLLIGGGAAAGLGALTLATGAVLYGVSLLTYGDCTAQADGGGFQSDVAGCLDVANAEAGVGIGLTLAGVALAGVGGALIAIDVAGE